MSKKSNPEQEAFRAWFKAELDKVVDRMIKKKAVAGAAIDAAPAWAVPNQVLIARLWSAAQKSQFIWTISGPDVITDHIPGSLAVGPKEAATHFALKWQADAENLLKSAENPSLNETVRSELKNQANKLIGDAESLFDLTLRDDIWR
jgi:hypothetical protein